MRLAVAVSALPLLLAACAPDGRPAAAGAECAVDADCVPAACCHATACVAKAAAPDCRAVMCTMECRPGTLDCGGACLCRAGRCAARLASAPAGRDAMP